MKKVILNIAMLAFSSSLLLTSCKKADDAEPDYSELSQQSSDNSSVQRESDQALDDANTLLEGSSLGARVDNADSTVVKIDSSQFDSNQKRKFIFNYKNKLKDGKMKSGRMIAVLTSGTKWSDEGAVLTLTFDTLKVTRNGKSVIFSGTKTITNLTVGGGRIKDVIDGKISSVTHKVTSSDLKITFEDGTTKTWTVSKTRVFTKDSNGLVITVSGDAVTKIAESGFTRKGTPFTTTIDEPIVFSSCNNDPKPISGKKTHKGLVKEVSVSFGYNSSGVVTNSCDATSFKVNWLNRKGESQQIIASY